MKIFISVYERHTHYGLIPTQFSAHTKHMHSPPSGPTAEVAVDKSVYFKRALHMNKLCCANTVIGSQMKHFLRKGVISWEPNLRPSLFHFLRQFHQLHILPPWLRALLSRWHRGETRATLRRETRATLRNRLGSSSSNYLVAI